MHPKYFYVLDGTTKRMVMVRTNDYEAKKME